MSRSGDHLFTLAGAALVARPSGALWWPDRRLLCVADLHFGKSARLARRGGTLLPPYEATETLARLDDEVAALAPATVLCLGDSFDDLESAGEMPDREAAWLSRLMAGRRWLWVEGNHDPGPLGLGGSHLAEFSEGPLIFRHIAAPGGTGEVSGHYHPKLRLALGGASVSRPCFLVDADRLILPAFGAYTGGMAADRPPLCDLMGQGARALLTGPRVQPLPLRPVRG